MSLQKCIEKLVERHGGVRSTAKAAGIDPGYLSRGAGRWTANPWVWVIEFRRMSGGQS